jgi:hypothetical protein
MKICPGCQVNKEDVEFAKNKSRKDGLNAYCKICSKLYNQKYYILNKEKLDANNKEYALLHKEEIVEYKKEYYENNKEVILEAAKEYRENNKEVISIRKKKYYYDNQDSMLDKGKKYYNDNKEDKLLYQKEYATNNKEKIALAKRNYYINNKEEIIAQHVEYEKERIKNDPVFKFRKLVSKSIRYALKNNGFSKNEKSCLDYLEYTFDTLIDHIESQFEWWMTWDNHGAYNLMKWDDDDPSTWTWNIDHIIPQSLLPYSSMEDDNFKKCWALENLRPLSAKQNILDGNRRVENNE